MKRNCVEVTQELIDAATAGDTVTGYTHNFYRYPARFSPLFAREAISHFSALGDVVLDPFMGGGTTIVESIALGRRAIGVDLNTLAHFVSRVKTSPLAQGDVEVLFCWLDRALQSPFPRSIRDSEEPLVNLPWHIQRVFSTILSRAERLPLERQRQFVRCALLKTGQWALDCKKIVPSGIDTIYQFSQFIVEMIAGMDQFIAACHKNGMPKPKIRPSRMLLCRSTVGLERDATLKRFKRPKLVLTSPPYPAVHILYHRWQVQGRRETPAAYWLAAEKDGHAASHYTFGSRSPLGLTNYFRNVADAFRSVRRVVHPNALVIQMIAFSDINSQLPRYLAAMNAAGFSECEVRCNSGEDRLWRNVPNRKWYCSLGPENDSAKELVLFHCPS